MGKLLWRPDPSEVKINRKTCRKHYSGEALFVGISRDEDLKRLESRIERYEKK